MLAEKNGVLRVKVVKGLRRIPKTFRFYKTLRVGIVGFYGVLLPLISTLLTF